MKLVARILTLLGVLSFIGFSACNGIISRRPVDAEGLFGVTRRTFYHLDSATKASIVDVPAAATKATLYTFNASSGLKVTGEASFDSIRLSADKKSITMLGSPSIYELKQLTPEEITAPKLETLQPQIESICIGSPFSKDTFIGTSAFKELQFVQDGSKFVLNAFDQNGAQQIASSYQREETATQTIFHVPEIGDFQIRLWEPASTGSHFFHAVVTGQWTNVTNLYCQENRAAQVGVKITAVGSGTFTVPADVGAISIELWGAGGGGGEGDTQASGGAGGGAYLKKTVTVTPGTVINYAVGAGGLPGAATEGANGGNTTCSTYSLTAGGGGGSLFNNGSGVGSGGTATGGDIQMNGTAGLSAPTGSKAGAGGNGANGGAGGAGNGPAGNDGDPNGAQPGGGGGGGPMSGNLPGGAGGDGQVVISYVAP